MTMTQMNVRIDAEIKRRGDAALASIGYTPSRFIHESWEALAANTGNPHRLHEIADVRQPQRNEDEIARKLELLHAGTRLFDETMAKLGVTDYHDAPVFQLSFDELRWEAYQERQTDKEWFSKPVARGDAQDSPSGTVRMKTSFESAVAHV